MKIRLTPKLAAAAAAGTLLLGSAAAAAATASPSAATGGKIRVWVSPSKDNSPTQRILITGAIGDYGKATSTTKSGTTDPNGEYVHIHLQQGTFRVNATAFNNKARNTQPTMNKKTCTAWEIVSGPVTLFDGTGAYAGISGTVRINTSFAGVFPRYASGPKKGQCKLGNNVAPLDQFSGPIFGSGSVGFGS